MIATDNNNSNTAKNRIKAGAAGGVEAVVKAINTHISNVNVCENGCGVLWNITFNNSKDSARLKK